MAVPPWEDDLRWRPGERLRVLAGYGLGFVVCVAFVVLMSLAGN